MRFPFKTSSFFLQGSWLMIASTLSGLFMFAAHGFAPRMGAAEYGLFNAVLQLLNLMVIPGLALQSAFAQQSAGAVNASLESELAGATRALLKTMSLAWLALAALVLSLADPLSRLLKIANLDILPIALGYVLAHLALPVFMGLIQGRQNFLWFGLAALLNGAGRFLAVGILVGLLGGFAASGVFGAFLGLLTALAAAGFQSRFIWAIKPKRFQWRPWLKRVVPLTLGLGASQFLLAADMVYVRIFFENEAASGFYGAAGMIGRGLVMFSAPLVWVMFPKAARAHAADEPSKVLEQTLKATGALAIILASGCAAAAWTGIWFVNSNENEALAMLPASVSDYLAANSHSIRSILTLVPWFVGAMYPLCLANVILNHLLARRVYRIVPWMMVLIAAYVTGLSLFGGEFKDVLKVLAAANAGLLALSAYFHRLHFSDKL